VLLPAAPPADGDEPLFDITTLKDKLGPKPGGFKMAQAVKPGSSLETGQKPGGTCAFWKSVAFKTLKTF
jgi:hypothetical protein